MLKHHDNKRHFLERARHIASHIRLPEHLVGHLSEHLHQISTGKAPIVWIQGMGCSGCSVSFLDSDHSTAADLAFGKISLRYQPDIMAASGQQAVAMIEETESRLKDRYILVVEGALPSPDRREFCTFGLSRERKDLMGRSVHRDRSTLDWVEELVPEAEAVVAVGNCASFGGIPKANREVNGATPVSEVVEMIHSGKPVINVTGCPPHPDWMMGTIAEVILWMNGKKEAPDLDEKRRLKVFYEKTIHDNCERRQAFENKQFLTDWNDPDQEKLCLVKFGCKGPSTHADCPVRRWNYHTNWCVGTNSPCQGCAEPGFYERLPHKIPKPK